PAGRCCAAGCNPAHWSGWSAPTPVPAPCARHRPATAATAPRRPRPTTASLASSHITWFPARRPSSAVSLSPGKLRHHTTEKRQHIALLVEPRLHQPVTSPHLAALPAAD